MTGAFSPKLVAPGEGKTVMLFGVRFSHQVLSADAAGSLTVEVEIPPGDLGEAAQSLPRGRVLAGALGNGRSP